MGTTAQSGFEFIDENATATIEEHPIEFIDENGGGPGVRTAKAAAPISGFQVERSFHLVVLRWRVAIGRPDCPGGHRYPKDLQKIGLLC
jgi:hypothetical protein